MSKKVMKLFSVLVMVVMVVTFLSQVVFAETASSVLKPTYFDNEQGIESVQTKTKTVMATAVRVVQIVGVAVAVIMLVVLGIKYVSASPSEKADIKKSVQQNC